jgi:hypothetical protein
MMLILPGSPAFLLVPALIAAPSMQTWELDGAKYGMRIEGPVATLFNAQGHVIHTIRIQGSARVVGLTKPNDDPLSESPGRKVVVDGVTYTLKALQGASGTLLVVVLNDKGHVIWAILPADPDPQTHV